LFGLFAAPPRWRQRRRCDADLVAKKQAASWVLMHEGVPELRHVDRAVNRLDQPSSFPFFRGGVGGGIVVRSKPGRPGAGNVLLPSK
jgi:hypothetical protein